eukprot:scaffold55228_cov62-Attheya_sp.AAC.11
MRAQWQISSFHEGKSNILGLGDPNHNAKNSRYQMIGGSWATTTIMDPWILKSPGVPQELWRIQDYASDLLVLRLA